MNPVSLNSYKCLITGREFFVGLSHFTNEAGARAVAAAFPEYPCVPIKVSIRELYNSYKLTHSYHLIFGNYSMFCFRCKIIMNIL